MNFENRNYVFAGAFVDELARAGLRHVCICPGSRSSPLTISLARHPGIQTWVHLDERSAGYFALGMAKSLQEPVAVVCSSGTASTNFHPAVAEAHNDCVPLIVLTADRPPEMRSWGALQTIEQQRLYGTHAKWSVDMPTPEMDPNVMAYVRSIANRGYATAQMTPEGPVHFNFPFREPLEPVKTPTDSAYVFSDANPQVWEGRTSRHGYLKVTGGQRALARQDVENLTHVLRSCERGIIVCGPQPNPALAPMLVDVAKSLNYPILADILSLTRCGSHDKGLVMDCYDAFLRESTMLEYLKPDVILRFGAVPVSKPLAQYLDYHHDAVQILVDEHEMWRDPSHVAAEILHVDPTSLCSELKRKLDPNPATSEWASRWIAVNHTTKMAIETELEQFSEIFEGRIIAELRTLIRNGDIIVAGNSMPVRDLDTFYAATDVRTLFFANRGASGIDGVVSTACGVAVGTKRRVVLVIGDISFYHDMNGLLLASTYAIDLTIVILNNNGGGIFSFLPQAEHSDVFEKYFGTPHGLTFEAAATLYKLGYKKATGYADFRQSVQESLVTPGTTVIEVASDRSKNTEQHRRVWNTVSKQLLETTGGLQ